MTQKNIFKLFLPIVTTITLLCGMTVSSSAAELVASGNFGGNVPWQLTDDGVLTVSGTGAMMDLDYVSGICPWWAIEEYEDSITSCVVEEGITTIGINSFPYLENLQSIVLPKSLIAISIMSFPGCSSLTHITLPDGIPTVPWWSFRDCTSLKSITLPSSITYIESGAFMNCPNITDIYYGGTQEMWAAVEIEEGDNDSFLTATVHFTDEADVVPPPDPPHVNNYCGGNVTWQMTDDETLVVSGTGAIWDYPDGTWGLRGGPWPNEITSCIIGEGVTSIGFRAFRDRTMVSLSLPSTLTNIDRDAFSDCSSLLRADIPDNVTDIGRSAFSGCESLSSLSLSKSLSTLGDSAFSGCVALPSISLPETVFHIGESAFRRCSSLEEISIPSLVNTIHDFTFSFCSSLKRVSLPAGLVSIGEHAFFNCESLTDVYYAGTEEMWAAISIAEGNEALQNANIHFTSKPHIQLIRGVCGEDLYWTLSKNKTLTISGTGSLPDYTDTDTTPPWIHFRPFIDVEDIFIAEGVSSIGDSALSNLPNATVLSVPESLETVGANALDGCKNLTNFHYPGTKEAWNSVEIKAGNEWLLSVTAHFSDLIEGPCSDALRWVLSRDGNLTISGTGSMADNSTPWDEFFSEISITSIVVDAGVTSISAEAFSGLPALANVSLPDGLVTIGDSAFEYCDNLLSVTIPDTVTSVGEYAFSSCPNLSDVTLSKNLSTIATGAFSYCTNLRKITIPDGVTALEPFAFNSCSNLTDISLPRNLESIGGYTFDWCENLSRIFLPDSLQVIGTSVFENCEKLRDIYYTGTETQWESMEIGSYNYALFDALIHYNSALPGTVDFPSSPAPVTSEQAEELLDRVNSSEVITVTLPAETASVTKTMLVPIYDDNGRMVAFQMIEVEANDADFSASFTFSNAETAASMNILLLDDDWTPVSEHLQIAP